MIVRCHSALPSSSPARPNILVLFADDLGYGDLSSFGHPTTVTPHLDSLARDGIKFTAWYSAFHVCSPSRGSMMTGRLPIRLGLAGASWTGGVFNADAIGGLPKNETTIAAALKHAGYASKAVGKWHLGQRPEFLPTSHGFDEYYGIPYSVDMGTSAWRTGLDHDRPYLPLIRSAAPGHMDVLEQPVDLNTLSGKYVNESAAFIESQSEQDTPWFLYVAFNHMHVPDFVSPAYCNMTRRGVYGDALGELDDAVGGILSAVDAAGAAADTIVFFTSDNGPWLRFREAGGSAGLLRDGKTTTWEGGIRVPGIARWTGKIPAGRVERSPVATYDIYATALALAGVDSRLVNGDRIIDGVDLSPVLFTEGNDQAGLTKDLHRCLFHYKGTPGLGCPPEHPGCPGLWAVRCGHFKMHYVTTDYRNESVQMFHDPPLMFHVDHDPGESFPLDPADPVYKAAREELDGQVAAHKRSLRKVPNQIAMGNDPKLAICCDRRRACNCNPENMRVFVCDGDDQFDDGGVMPTLGPGARAGAAGAEL